MFFVPIISSAESIQAMQKVKPLMTSSQVEEIMGASDSFKVAQKDGNDYVLNQWTNRLCNDWWIIEFPLMERINVLSILFLRTIK